MHLVCIPRVSTRCVAGILTSMVLSAESERLVFHKIHHVTIAKNTEAYLFSAQEQALNTNAIRSNNYREVGENGEVVSALCRVCGLKTETVAYIAGECGVLMGGPVSNSSYQ